MALSPTKTLWQEALSDLITDPQELFTLLSLDPVHLPAAYAAARIFPLKVTRGFVARMQKGDLHDPLLRQVLPLGLELEVVSGYVHDPLAEAEANPVPGLLHKYHGRVLVTLTSACAIHCRYCFRRYFPYAENNPGRLGWEKIFSYIAANPTIKEVILSGGDPLSVSDSLLLSFCEQLSAIAHVKTIRIHTRLPIVLPERITDRLVAGLTALKQRLVIVLHTNHPNEVNDDVRAALQRLRGSGAQLLNQSVLLKEVNNQVDTLAQLSEVLFATGVLPYYLHVSDKVAGTAHFDLPLTEAKALHLALTARLPGYLVPRLVREDAGAFAKTLV